MGNNVLSVTLPLDQVFKFSTLTLSFEPDIKQAIIIIALIPFCQHVAQECLLMHTQFCHKYIKDPQ
jgi:hypothetical protein